jgi:ABC-2 type transport system permease protein
VITLLNPVTYAVHAIRTAVFDVLDAPPESLAQLNPPIEWFGWEVPVVVQLGVVVVTGLALLWFAIVQFNRSE